MSDQNAPYDLRQLSRDYERAGELHGRGQFEQAERIYRMILSVAPQQPDTLHMLGILLIQTGRADGGFALIDQALSSRPDFVDAHFNRGVALLQLGRTLEAVASFDRVLAIDRGNLGAHASRSAALMQVGRPAEALPSFDAVLAAMPGDFETLVNRGLALGALDRPAEALASFDRALAVRPGDYAAIFNRGVALSALRRFDEALVAADRALAIQPGDPQGLFNRGVALKQMLRPDEALESFDRALAIQPNYVSALVNRGVTLKMLGRLDEALESSRRALALQPDQLEALANRGAALDALGRHDEALAAYDQALAINPAYPLAAFNKSLILLQAGRFDAGWPLYENRKRLEGIQRRAFSQPAWTGEAPLAGKTLFVHWEQGFGDTLQFCRYASLAADRGAQVVLSVQDELRALFGSFDPRVQVLGGDTTPSAFDYHAALMSLPLALGGTMETIPSAPAWLKADAGKAAAWSRRLGPKTRPRVGLVWSGRPQQENDRNRSAPLSALAPLLSVDADWISLQKDVRDSDRPALEGHPQLRDFSADLTDFSETAALIENLDLVITVCTGVAHLAGALGKPSWVLLAFNADWRWFQGRDDSPWYPSVRLFRQPSIGAWDPVVDRARQALISHIEASA